MSSNNIFVKIFRHGAPAVEVLLTPGSTVASALENAQMTKKSSEAIEIRSEGSRSSETASMETELQDGDSIILTKNVEGALS